MIRKKIYCSLCSLLFLGNVAFGNGFGLLSSDVNQIPVTETITLNADSSSTTTSFYDKIIQLISEKGASIVKSTLPTVGDYLCAKVFSALGIDYTDSYTAEISKIYSELTAISTQLEAILNQFDLNILRDFNKTLKAVSKAVTPTYKTYDQLRADELANKYTEEETKKEEKALFNIIEKLTTEAGPFYSIYQDFLQLIVTPDNINIYKTLIELYTTCFKSQWAFETEALAAKKDFLTQISIVAYQGFSLWTYVYYYSQETTDTNVDKDYYHNVYTQMQGYAESAFQVLQSELNAVIKAENDGLNNSQTTHYYNDSATSKVDVRVSTKLYNGKLFSTRPRDGQKYGTYSDSTNYFSYGRKRRHDRNNRYDYWHSYLVNLDLGRQIAADYNAYKTRTKQDSSFTLSKYMTYLGFTNADENAKGLYIGQQYRHTGTVVTNEYYYWDVIYIDQNGQEQTVNYTSLSEKVWQSRQSYYTEHCTDSFFAIVDTSGYLYGSYTETHIGYGNTANDVYYILGKPKTYTVGEKLGKVY